MRKCVAFLSLGIVFGVHGVSLEEAIVSAYNNNVGWKASQAEKNAALEQYKHAEAAFLPTLDATFSAAREGNDVKSYNRREVEKSRLVLGNVIDNTGEVVPDLATVSAIPYKEQFYEHNRNVSKQTQTQMALQLNQNLFNSFKDVNNVRAKKNLVRAAFHKLKKAEQDLIVNVVKTYTEVWAERQKLLAHIKKEQNLKKLHESQEICLAAGMATPADVAEAESKYQTAVYERVDAETKVVEAEVKFRHITGLQADKKILIPNLNIKLPKDLNELEKIALRSNQEILHERFKNQSAENELDIAKGELGPKCDLKLQAGRTLNKPNDFYKRTSQNRYSAELSVTVPIFHMQNYANVGVYSEKAKQTKFAAEDKVLEIKKNCKIYWRTYKSAEASIKASSTAVKSAEITSESNLDQTNLGMKSNTEFLDAETSLLKARINLADSIKNKIDAAIQLFALTGNLDLRSMLITLQKNKGVLDPMEAAKAKGKIKKAKRAGKKISKEDWIKKLAEKREIAAQQKQSNKLNNKEEVTDQRGRVSGSVKP